MHDLSRSAFNHDRCNEKMGDDDTGTRRICLKDSSGTLRFACYTLVL